MQEDLKYLLQLSAVDKKVYELKQTRRDLPFRVQSLKDAIEKEKVKFAAIQNEIAETKAKIKENQDLVVTETLTLQASSSRLNNISTNREYDAVHMEIATHKKNIDTAQAHVLHFQQILENFQKDMEQIEAHYNQVKESNEPELNKLVEELNGIEDRIAEEAKKDKYPREKIGKKLLTLYDRIAKRRNTPHVIAALNFSHRSCDVCSRSQTSQRLIELNKQSAILTCESCGSILVWLEEESVET